MARSWTLTLIFVVVLGSDSAAADRSRQITKQADPLVRALEGIYAKSMQVAESGDLDTYWQFRTLASKERPPYLTKALLPLFAQMLPPLETLQFVRMDATPATARSLYRWPRGDVARYTVIVYRIEQGDWRIDSVQVKTDAVANTPEAKPTEAIPPRQRRPGASSSTSKKKETTDAQTEQ